MPGWPRIICTSGFTGPTVILLMGGVTRRIDALTNGDPEPSRCRQTRQLCAALAKTVSN